MRCDQLVKGYWSDGYTRDSGLHGRSSKHPTTTQASCDRNGPTVPAAPPMRLPIPNPNPNPNPNHNHNPKTHPNPNPILTLTRTLKIKENKNDTGI